MSKTAFLTARIEPNLKKRASRVLDKVGVSTTDAITMFLRQVVMRGGLPFDVRAPATARSRTKRKHGNLLVVNGLHNTHQPEHDTTH